AARTNAHVRNGCFHELHYAIQVAARFRWQVLHLPRVCGGLLPAVEPLVTRAHPVQSSEVTRELREHLSIHFISRADLEFLQRIEHVQLRHRQTRQAIDACRITNHHGIEPPAPAGATGGSAEFVAQLAYTAVQRLIELGRQRAVAYTRGVRLDHADHRIDQRGSDSCTGGGTARRGAAGGDERVRAMIHVQKGALCAFEQYRSTVL